MKQVLLSLAAVVIAAGILAGMLMYSFAVIRTVQIRMLTGDLCPVDTDYMLP